MKLEDVFTLTQDLAEGGRETLPVKRINGSFLSH